MFWTRRLTGPALPTSLALVASLALFGGAGSARAGEYHVYGCRMPDGTVAPTDGWTEAKVGSSDSTQNTCATGGSLVAALSDGSAHEVEVDRAGWMFSSPAQMAISSARLLRAGDADGGWATNATYEFWLAGPENKDVEADVIDQCVAEFGCPTGVGDMSDVNTSSNIVTVQPNNLGSHLYLNVSCAGNPKFVCPGGKGDSENNAAVVYLYASDLILQQSSQPTVSAVQGELATASPLAGTLDLSFHAEDPGSGVYQAVFTVDGVPVARTLLSENSGRCRPVGQTTDGLPAFLYLQPCPASLTADVPFDTTSLTDGTHHLLVSLTNAAGNSTPVLDRTVTVLNHPPATTSQTLGSTSPGQLPTTFTKNDPQSQQNPLPSLLPDNGSHASAGATLHVHWAATAHASLLGAYGRAQTVLGRLTAPDGSPIAGASLQVLSTPRFQGARTIVLPPARTASDGSFRVRLSASTPSTHLTLAYSSHLGQSGPDVIAPLDLTVPARLTLRVTPRTSHAGGTIVFAGTLLGAPLPRGGKQLVLEARPPGAPWRQFQVLSTAAHGRYRATYRFRLPGPIVYQFRAVSRLEADFPFATGSSPVVRVRER
jgi:hypothetical protein